MSAEFDPETAERGATRWAHEYRAPDPKLVEARERLVERRKRLKRHRA